MDERYHGISLLSCLLDEECRKYLKVNSVLSHQTDPLALTPSFLKQGEITTRIDTFLTGYREELSEMKDELFMEHLVGLAKNKLEMFNSLSEETGYYWSEMKTGRLEWEVYRNEVLTLRSFTKEKALTAFDSWLLPSKDGMKRDRRALVIQVIGCGDEVAAQGRPDVDPDAIPGFIDNTVRALHKSVGGKTWGKVY
jgi:nardilysin